jgi:hypothetical protein
VGVYQRMLITGCGKCFVIGGEYRVLGTLYLSLCMVWLAWGVGRIGRVGRAGEAPGQSFHPVSYYMLVLVGSR